MKPKPVPKRQRAAGTQAVHRALHVLRVIARGRDQGVGLSAICRQSGLNKSTAHRLASALVAAGLVEAGRALQRLAIDGDDPAWALWCGVVGLGMETVSEVGADGAVERVRCRGVRARGRSLTVRVRAAI